MPHPLEDMIGELERSFAATQRVLEAIPEDKLDWRPESRGFSLGELAMHTAQLPGGIPQMALAGRIDVAMLESPPTVPESKQAILDEWKRGKVAGPKALRGFTAEQCAGEFKIVSGDQVVMAMPVPLVIREILLNHTYHHRGQMTTYLRAIGASVPAVFGNSADENPFAVATG